MKVGAFNQENALVGGPSSGTVKVPLTGLISIAATSSVQHTGLASDNTDHVLTLIRGWGPLTNH